MKPPPKKGEVSESKQIKDKYNKIKAIPEADRTFVQKEQFKDYISYFKLKSKPKKSSGNILSGAKRIIGSLLSLKRQDEKKKPTTKEHKAGLGGIGKYVRSGGKY